MKSALKRTWHAFFARFGGMLRPVQEQGMPDILSGRDVLLVAPTASGKTEAVAAPLIERLLAQENPATPAIVYVSPTRALANDLLRRLEGPCQDLDIRVARRTGDHPGTMRAAHRPHLLLTTPESLDSMLCRMPAAFRGVQALVLDEIHLLLGSARGDQLAVLASRLERIAAGRLQRLVLSATVADTDAVARRYLHDAVIHRVAGSRPLEVTYLQGDPGEGLDRRLRQAMERCDLRKVLAFVDRRADAEMVVSALRGRAPFGDAVFAHHGSLERARREWVEQQMLERPRAFCVATSTLEVGIDIGDVDAVLLLDAPASVTSLLQRIGRGSRRTRLCRVLVEPGGPGHRQWMDTLLDLAAREELAEDPLPFRPGVLPQQALSLAMQNPDHWISAKVLHERLPPDCRDGIEPAELDALLAGLAAGEWLLPGRAGRYHPADRTLQAFERGRIHDVIESEAPPLEVVDELTGESLGRIDWSEGEERIAFGGRSWTVVGGDEKTVRVRGGIGGAAPPSFRGRMGPSCSRRLCRHFQDSLGPLPGWPLVLPARSGVGTDVYHFLGTAAGQVLAAAVSRVTGLACRRPGALAFTWRGDDLARLARPDRAVLQATVRAQAGNVARRLGCGPYTATLPRSLLERFALTAIDVDSLSSCLDGWNPCADVPDGVAELLAELRWR